MTLNYDYVEAILRVIEEDKKCKASDYILKQDINKIIEDAQHFAVEAECEYCEKENKYEY